MADQDLREIKDNFLLEAGLVDARTSLQEMKISEYWDDKKIELKKDYEVDGGTIRFYSDNEALYTQYFDETKEPMAFYYVEALDGTKTEVEPYLKSNITNWTADSTDPSSMTSAAVYKGIITDRKKDEVTDLDAVEYSDIKDLENIPSLYDPKKDSFYFENELLDRYMISKNGRGGKPPKFKN